MPENNSPEADIGMIFEGSYPYVSGGVSSWAQQLIESLPEFTFSVIAILPDKKPRKLKYNLPGNVENLHHIYIYQEDFDKRLNFRGRFEWGKIIEDYHKEENIFNRDFFSNISELFESENPPDIKDLIGSYKSFEMLTRQYDAKAPDASFLDYVWTWRFMHLGILEIMSAPLHHCRSYHAISTGYSGIYGCRLKHLYDRPYLLTEHGIYTRERKIEITRSDWIYDKKKEEIRPERTLGVFKSMWIKAFRTMSRLTYQFTDEIITLYPGNQEFQLEDGAQKEKLRIIYNGIDFEHYHALKKERIPGRFTIVLIGRVVPVKDIKTFIRCVKILSRQIPELKALVMGPTDEDPKYYQECRQLVNLLAIEDFISFTGKVSIVDYYPEVDVLVLTSISEAQPLVIIEGNAAGIPAVCTDVGDCRDLLYGRAGEDREMGKSGLIFNMANPEQAAEHIFTLYRDLSFYKHCSETGIKRVSRYYKKEYQINSYRELYGSYL
ncbi:MAG: GT4 family glycosyltransferase PelF [bacterium]